MTPLAMILYPFAAAFVFRLLPFVLAIPSALLMGYLLLPARVSYNLPLLPTLTKESTAVFVTMLMILIYAPRPSPFQRGPAAESAPALTVLPGWVPRVRWAQVAILLFVLAPMMTALTNRDWLSFGPTSLPALTLYDGANMVQIALVAVLPFLIGRRYLAGEDGHRALLLALLAAGLAYSLPTLFEVRMSPQLHNIVYGYFPHDFAQHIRGDGFRPVVFLTHGLVLSMFLCTAALAIAAYMRAVEGERRILYFLAAAYMVVVVFLSKSLGMVLVACALLPVLVLAPVRAQMMVAGTLAALVFAYPFLRIAGINPLMLVADFVGGFAPMRAESLAFRLNMEDGLIDRLLERPLFGWGSWGRSELWSDQGLNQTVRDGLWIIWAGERGILGFIGQFGLFCLPIVLLAVKSRSYALTAATSGLCIVLVANALDLIPNAGITPYTFLMAGALAGRLELGALGAPVDDAAAARLAGATVRSDGGAAWPGAGGQVYTRAGPAPERPASARSERGNAAGPRPATGRIGPPAKVAAPARGETGAETAAKTQADADGPAARPHSRYPIRPTRRPGRA